MEEAWKNAGFPRTLTRPPESGDLPKVKSKQFWPPINPESNEPPKVASIILHVFVVFIGIEV